MELKSDLSKVKVGDWVLVLSWGWKKVSAINTDEDALYKVRVDLDNHNSDTFTLEGKNLIDAIYPACFPANQVPECFLELYGPPPVEFEENEPVWVSDEGVIWKVAMFINRDEDGTYWVYDTVNTSHYSSGRKGYKYCRKITDEL